MSLGRIDTLGAGPQGFVATRVSAQIQGGLPETRILGCPKQGALRDRLRSAIKGAGFKYPSCRVTLDLEAPDCPWEEEHLLPAALAILIATGQARASSLEPYRWLGRLRLDGGIEQAQTPWSRLTELGDDTVVGNNGRLSIQHLRDLTPKTRETSTPPESVLLLPAGAISEMAQWVLAGAHSLFAYGEPGAGKSRTLLQMHKHWPDSAQAHCHRWARWHRRRKALPKLRRSLPARSTPAQLTHWCEIYQGHAITIDDLPLHSSGLKDRLTQRMDEDPSTAIMASANPCACGWLGSDRKACRCDQTQRQRWQRLLPNPLLDRFDVLWRFEYTDQAPAPCSLDPITQAQRIQRERQGCLNGQIPAQQLSHIPGLSPALTRLLRLQASALGLSGRAQLSVAKVARTLADLRQADTLREDDLMQSLALRASPLEL